MFVSLTPDTTTTPQPCPRCQEDWVPPRQLHQMTACIATCVPLSRPQLTASSARFTYVRVLVDIIKIIPGTAFHKLLEGDTFPSFYPTGYGENVKQCPDHPDEEIKFYCPSHDVLCCRDCNVLDKHDQCTKQSIPQISKEFHKSSEYTKLKKELQSSEDKIKDFFLKNRHLS